MHEFFDDFREALAVKMKCLGISSFVLAKYMAMLFIPLYIIYVIIN